ncbi:MAG: AAA family ATPase [Planctomycetota bacterium]|jgi:DNA polymerase III gamma/tau subunit
MQGSGQEGSCLKGNLPLFEAYRPRTWGEFIGHEKAIARVEALRKRGFGGRAYWINGQSGTGKTTLAYLIAGELADDFDIEELDAGAVTPAKLRQIESGMVYAGLGKGGRAYIVNEAHGLSKSAIRQFLVLLERLPKHVAFIFTTTRQGQDSLFDDSEDAGPLLSRCAKLELARRNLAEAFADRAREIAREEGLDGKSPGAYLELARQCRNNMRAMLQEVEAGAMLA